MGKSGITIKNSTELEAIGEAARIVAMVLEEIRACIRPGISTLDVNNLAEGIILREGGQPKFKGYRGFPAAVCASVNDEVVHGIPRADKILSPGDILSVDVGVELCGYCGDGASTYPVGEISVDAEKLLRVTEEALRLGIEAAVVDNRVSDISKAVQRYVEGHGFSVVRALVGHGIGRDLHEEPQIPNFVSRGRKSPKLLNGMVLAIEPMVNAGAYDVVFEDQWTTRSKDRSLSAHFEHTIAVTRSGPKILTKTR